MLSLLVTLLLLAPGLLDPSRLPPEAASFYGDGRGGGLLLLKPGLTREAREGVGERLCRARGGRWERRRSLGASLASPAAAGSGLEVGAGFSCRGGSDFLEVRLTGGALAGEGFLILPEGVLP